MKIALYANLTDFGFWGRYTAKNQDFTFELKCNKSPTTTVNNVHALY